MKKKVKEKVKYKKEQSNPPKDDLDLNKQAKAERQRIELTIRPTKFLTLKQHFSFVSYS